MGASLAFEPLLDSRPKMERSIEAPEGFLWRYPQGHGSQAVRMRAIGELARFECVQGSPGLRAGCGPSESSPPGHDSNRYGG